MQKSISVGQNLSTLADEGSIVERYNYENKETDVGFALIRRPNSQNIEGVMFNTVTQDVLYVFRRPVTAPQVRLGMNTPFAPLCNVQPKYIHDEFFREDIGHYFFRKHATNLELLQAVWCDDRKKILEIDPLFYGMLWTANYLRRSDDPYSLPLRKLYPAGVFGVGADNLRFIHNEKELSCSRTMVMYFRNVDTGTNVPPIIVEYAFHHPRRSVPGRVSGSPHVLKLSRTYYHGEWPNIKVFMDDPRNKPYLDLFYAENP